MQWDLGFDASLDGLSLVDSCREKKASSRTYILFSIKYVFGRHKCMHLVALLSQEHAQSIQLCWCLRFPQIDMCEQGL